MEFWREGRYMFFKIPNEKYYLKNMLKKAENWVFKSTL